MAKSYSLSIRLQRITKEFTHVSVPITPEILQPTADAPNNYRINREKLLRAAINLGLDPRVKWSLDGEAVITAHPLQTAPE